LKTLLLEVVIPIILIITGLGLSTVRFFKDPVAVSINPSDVFSLKMPFPVGVRGGLVTEPEALAFAT